MIGSGHRLEARPEPKNDSKRAPLLPDWRSGTGRPVPSLGSEPAAPGRGTPVRAPPSAVTSSGRGNTRHVVPASLRLCRTDEDLTSPHVAMHHHVRGRLGYHEAGPRFATGRDVFRPGRLAERRSSTKSVTMHHHSCSLCLSDTHWGEGSPPLVLDMHHHRTLDDPVAIVKLD